MKGHISGHPFTPLPVLVWIGELQYYPAGVWLSGNEGQESEISPQVEFH